MRNSNGARQDPAATTLDTDFADDSNPPGDARFPDGLHRGRLITDVALDDPVLGRGVYIRVRARRPRPWWDATLVDAIRAVAEEFGEAAA